MNGVNFSLRTEKLQGSAIRESFKALSRPGMISFAGGMPAPESYPAEEFSRIAREILESSPVTALQYGITEGFAPLVEKTKARLAKAGIGGAGDALIITSGGQQALELVAKILVNEGDAIACENPSFIGALNAFRSFNARLLPVPMESDGMDVDVLEALLQAEPSIRLIYTIPTFQNPTGITMSLEKRRRLLALAEGYGVFVLEDSPYFELRFGGDDIPSVKSMDTTGRVLYAGSYSKILAPGLRVGFLTGPEELVEKAVVCKQVSDVHTAMLPQMMVDMFLENYDISRYIARSARLNGEKCAFMQQCLDRYVPASVTRTRPRGGLFLWCDLNDGSDSRALAARCVENGVAIVSGSAAQCDPSAPTSAFRLNFSMASMEEIEKGIRILGDVIKDGRA